MTYLDEVANYIANKITELTPGQNIFIDTRKEGYGGKQVVIKHDDGTQAQSKNKNKSQVYFDIYAQSGKPNNTEGAELLIRIGNAIHKTNYEGTDFILNGIVQISASPRHVAILEKDQYVYLSKFTCQIIKKG